MPDPVLIAGFFPPPITGQGLATQRLTELLADTIQVHTINLREGETHLDLKVKGRMKQKIKSYRKAGRRLNEATSRHPGATVFWTAISPEPLGHLRDLLTIAPAFKPGQRVFAVVHWGRFSKLFESWLTRTTAKRLIARLAGVVFLNPHLADQCAPWIPAEKRIVIPNTLDEATLCSEDEVIEKQKKHDDSPPLKLLFLSHMIREKGYFDAIRAVDILNRRGYSIQATFAGQWLNDEDKKAFDTFVKANQLESIVTHLGSVTERDQIKALHLASDVFLLPSYLIEGQPLTIIEAMNAGSPIITTRIGGMVDMIEDGKEGFFVSSENPEAIADAVRKLCDASKWQSASKTARQRYMKEYSADVVLGKWLALFNG